MTQFQQLSTRWMRVFSLPHNLPQIWNRFGLQVLWLLYYFKSPICCYITLLLLSWLLFFCLYFSRKNRINMFCLILKIKYIVQFSSVQSLSCVRLFATPWTAARQASLSITNYQSPPKPMSIESVMPSNHLILCPPFLLLPEVFPSIRLFSKWVSSSQHVAKVLEFQLQHQSFQSTPRTDLL